MLPTPPRNLILSPSLPLSGSCGASGGPLSASQSRAISALHRICRSVCARHHGGARVDRRCRLEPVSVGSRTSLCLRRQFSPGKGFAGAETRPRFWTTAAYFARQRLISLASPKAKARKAKDYSTGRRKPDLRRTAWWSWQDSNRQPSDYGRQERGARGDPRIRLRRGSTMIRSA